jgi:hypothetical protein
MTTPDTPDPVAAVAAAYPPAVAAQFTALTAALPPAQVPA